MNPPVKTFLAPRCVRYLAACALLALAACSTTARLPDAPPSLPELQPGAAPPDLPEATPPAVATPTPLAAVEPRVSNRERLLAVMDASVCIGDQRRLAGPFQPRHLQRVLAQRNDLFSWVLAEIHARKLPGQFVAMPVLESAYQADPGNRGAVRGLWQFSAATGKRFGLQFDAQRDDRLSAITSTRAALDHLGEMWRRWGDWRLAVIGFNAGEYAVTSALRRDPRALDEGRIPRSLPSRALQYTQRTQAVACLLLTEPGLQPWLDVPAPLLASHRLPAGLRSLEDALTLLGGDRETLLRLNPELGRRDFPLRASEVVLAHVGAGHSGPPAVAAPAEPPAPLPTDKPRESVPTHVVMRGDSPWTIARRHRVALRDLLRWNGLGKDSVLQPGQRLRLEP